MNFSTHAVKPIWHIPDFIKLVNLVHDSISNYAMWWDESKINVSFTLNSPLFKKVHRAIINDTVKINKFKSEKILNSLAFKEFHETYKYIWKNPLIDNSYEVSMYYYTYANKFNIDETVWKRSLIQSAYVGSKFLKIEKINCPFI